MARNATLVDRIEMVEPRRLVSRLLVIVMVLVACGTGGNASRPDGLVADTYEASPDVRLDVSLDLADAADARPETGVDAAPDPSFEVGEDVTELPEPTKGFSLFDLTAVGSVRSMWASQDDSVWAVGDKGLVLRYDGHDFVPVAPVPTLENLYGVAGAAGTVVVVGAKGTAMAWRDGRWTDLAPPAAAADLYGVGVLGQDDIYVAGQGGLILHLSGGQWEQTETGIDFDLYAIWASPTGGVFAAGEGGSILELKGSSWVRQQVGTPVTRFRSIWRASDGTMFAVGSSGAVAIYNKLVWKLEVTNDPSEPPRDLYQVFGFGPDEVFAVGSGGIVLRRDAKKWGVQTVAGPYNVTADLRCIAGRLLPDGKRQLFAAGLGGAALELVDKKWVDRTLGVTRKLFGVHCRGDGEVVAVGEHGLVLTYKGGRFGTIASGTDANLNAISGDFVVGDHGTLLFWSTGSFVVVPTSTEEDLSDVWAEGDSAWAVGRAGTVFGAFSDHAVQAGFGSARLEAVCTTRGGAVVAAGAGGRVLWNLGQGFQPVATGTTSDLWDLMPASDDEVFAVGDNGVVLRCKSAGCQRIFDEPTTFLYGVGGRPDLTLAAGWAGVVLRLDGGEPKRLETGCFSVFRAVAAGDKGPAYLVGDSGTFASYEP